MAMFEDEPRPRPVLAHTLGEDLSRLSEAELDERIALLRSEIVRLEEVLSAKRATREAAAAFFKS